MKKTRNKRNPKYWITLAFILCLSLWVPNYQAAAALKEEETKTEELYLKSATYYANDWVINFWNLEDDFLEEDLRQIAADGFNSIILAVPWREFQVDMDSRRYNQYALDKLHRVMDAAGEEGLLVILRVGYTWDHAGNGNILDRYRDLIYKEEVREAWMDYVGRIYEESSVHSNFYGGFLTWEDFWNFTDAAGALGDTEYSRRLAKDMGYTDYVKERVSLEEAGRQYRKNFEDWNQLYLPGRETEAYSLFLSFYDNFLNQLLAESQAVFPNLSMEVRADADPINNQNGELVGFTHETTFGCQDSAYTSLMYAVSMGMSLGNDHMTADQVLPQTAATLDWVRSHNGGKPLYIDQLLFTDNTPGFEENSRLDEGEIPIYLTRLAPVLQGRTLGYGVWTYRDYGNNMIYNCQFALGDGGWNSFGRTKVEERDGSNQMKLESYSRISQTVNTAGSAVKGDTVKVCFQADSPSGSNLTVSLGKRSRTVKVEGKQQLNLEFSGTGLNELSISSDSTVYLDNIKVYTQVTEGKLYDINGNPESCLEAVRILNSSL